MADALRSELAPTGTLRAGINMANFLLVTGRTPDGDPTGVAPDMARAIAERLGVPVSVERGLNVSLGSAAHTRSVYRCDLDCLLGNDGRRSRL